MTIKTEMVGPGFLALLSRRRRRGLALFDVILAVGIIGVLIAGGVLLLQTVNERIKRNDTMAVINQIRGEASRIYAGQPTMNSLAMNLLEKRGSLPDAVIRTSGSVYEHAYDAAINVWPITGKKQYIVGLAELDDGPCADLLVNFADKSRTVSGVRSLGVGAESTQTFGAPTLASAGVLDQTNKADKAAAGTPVTATTMTGAGWCDSGDGNNNVYLHFQG